MKKRTRPRDLLRGLQCTGITPVDPQGDISYYLTRDPKELYFVYDYDPPGCSVALPTITIEMQDGSALPAEIQFVAPNLVSTFSSDWNAPLGYWPVRVTATIDGVSDVQDFRIKVKCVTKTTLTTDPIPDRLQFNLNY